MSFLWLLEREREYYEKCITFSLLLQSNMLFVIFITKFLPNFHSLSIFKSSKMPSIEFHEFKSSNSNQVNKLPKKNDGNTHLTKRIWHPANVDFWYCCCCCYQLLEVLLHFHYFMLNFHALTIFFAPFLPISHILVCRFS